MLPTAAALTRRLPRPLRRHRLMTTWMRLTGEDPLQLVRIREGAVGYADMSDGFLRLIVIDGGYDDDFFRLADSLLAEGGEFFDVGANFGLLSFGLAARLADRVRFHLFEPIPRLQEAIARTLALYPAMTARVIAAAVTDFDGVIGFDVAEEQTGRSHIDPCGALQTRCIRLDSYLAEHGIADIGLLKLDVEGYELPALRGAATALAARRVKAIYFEYFEKYLVRVGPPAELIGFLGDAGYEVCFCRRHDLAGAGGATHTLADGLAGHGLPLAPVRGRSLPAMTDLFAAPKEHLVAL
ncbi:MAG TPA: FkbM family methyltransferase [Caulobacteraceae bacterium]|nr:FkbM family methyltransferase [Caulobacteraceae bacterium]